MEKYQDSDGYVWQGSSDKTLFLKGEGGQFHGIGVDRVHIESQVGPLVPVKEKL